MRIALRMIRLQKAIRPSIRRNESILKPTLIIIPRPMVRRLRIVMNIIK